MTMADESDPAAASGRFASTEPSTETPASEPSGSNEPAPQRESMIDAVANLLQMLVNWLRAEAADIMRDKVVLPIQQLGLTLVSAATAGCLAVIGLSFVLVAGMMFLAAWLGWPGSLLLVGSVVLLGAGVFTFVKMRSMQE
jgi:hypothetical protein